MKWDPRLLFKPTADVKAIIYLLDNDPDGWNWHERGNQLTHTTVDIGLWVYLFPVIYRGINPSDRVRGFALFGDKVRETGFIDRWHLLAAVRRVRDKQELKTKPNAIVRDVFKWAIANGHMKEDVGE